MIASEQAWGVWANHFDRTAFSLLGWLFEVDNVVTPFVVATTGVSLLAPIARARARARAERAGAERSIKYESPTTLVVPTKVERAESERAEAERTVAESSIKYESPPTLVVPTKAERAEAERAEAETAADTETILALPSDVVKLLGEMLRASDTPSLNAARASCKMLLRTLPTPIGWTMAPRASTSYAPPSQSVDDFNEDKEVYHVYRLGADKLAHAFYAVDDLGVPQPSFKMVLFARTSVSDPLHAQVHPWLTLPSEAAILRRIGNGDTAWQRDLRAVFEEYTQQATRSLLACRLMVARRLLQPVDDDQRHDRSAPRLTRDADAGDDASASSSPPSHSPPPSSSSILVYGAQW